MATEAFHHTIEIERNLYKKSRLGTILSSERHVKAGFVDSIRPNVQPERKKASHVGSVSIGSPQPRFKSTRAGVMCLWGRAASNFLESHDFPK
jgi:hypothetical protein